MFDAKLTFTDEPILLHLSIHRPQNIQRLPSSQSTDHISHQRGVWDREQIKLVAQAQVP